MLFGGNLLRQPAFVELKKSRPEAIRVVGNLDGSDQIMNSTIFLGTYPGLTQEMIDHEISVVSSFVSRSNTKT